jgi:hypothetical protein
LRRVLWATGGELSQEGKHRINNNTIHTHTHAHAHAHTHAHALLHTPPGLRSFCRWLRDLPMILLGGEVNISHTIKTSTHTHNIINTLTARAARVLGHKIYNDYKPRVNIPQ